MKEVCLGFGFWWMASVIMAGAWTLTDGYSSVRVQFKTLILKDVSSL